MKLRKSQLITLALAASASASAGAQTATLQPELPPARIEPGAKDRSFFVCTVIDVNYDYVARNMGNGHVNLWTRYMRGGKFEALGAERVRVRSASADGAAREVHEFYQRYAAAAFIRGPQYDKGTRPQAAVVAGCQPEPGREAAVSEKALDSASYRRVLAIEDHFYTALKYLPQPPSPEQAVQMADARALPSDAFDRKAEVDKRYAAIRQRLEATPRSAITLEATPSLEPYDFGSQTFSWPSVDADVSSYRFTVKGNERPAFGVTYDLATTGTLRAYRPKSMDEAKAIERARAANKLRMVTYAHVSGAVLQGQQIVVKGVVAAVEWLDEGGRVLARLEAK